MRKIGAFLLLAVIVITGCGTDRMQQPVAETMVIVRRDIHMSQLYPSPSIQIACSSASVDDVNRKVIIEGATGIGDWEGGNSWVCNVRIEDGRLILELPRDGEYTILINGAKYFLPRFLKNG